MAHTNDHPSGSSSREIHPRKEDTATTFFEQVAANSLVKNDKSDMFNKLTMYKANTRVEEQKEVVGNGCDENRDAEAAKMAALESRKQPGVKGS